VWVDDTGIYISGLRTGALLHLNRKFEVTPYCSLPTGVHNARPWRDGVLFNDTASDYKIVTYDESMIEFAGIDDSKIARQGFGRGLCIVDDRFIAAGSSPSTITLYDVGAGMPVGSVNLSMDIRNAIHGLEIWPYDN